MKWKTRKTSKWTSSNELGDPETGPWTTGTLGPWKWWSSSRFQVPLVRLQWKPAHPRRAPYHSKPVLRPSEVPVTGLALWQLVIKCDWQDLSSQLHAQFQKGRVVSVLSAARLQPTTVPRASLIGRKQEFTLLLAGTIFEGQTFAPRWCGKSGKAPSPLSPLLCQPHDDLPLCPCMWPALVSGVTGARAATTPGKRLEGNMSNMHLFLWEINSIFLGLARAPESDYFPTLVSFNEYILSMFMPKVVSEGLRM